MKSNISSTYVQNTELNVSFIKKLSDVMYSSSDKISIQYLCSAPKAVPTNRTVVASKKSLKNT